MSAPFGNQQDLTQGFLLDCLEEPSTGNLQSAGVSRGSAATPLFGIVQQADAADPIKRPRLSFLGGSHTGAAAGLLSEHEWRKASEGLQVESSFGAGSEALLLSPPMTWTPLPAVSAAELLETPAAVGPGLAAGTTRFDLEAPAAVAIPSLLAVQELSAPGQASGSPGVGSEGFGVPLPDTDGAWAALSAAASSQDEQLATPAAVALLHELALQSEDLSPEKRADQVNVRAFAESRLGGLTDCLLCSVPALGSSGKLCLTLLNHALPQDVHSAACELSGLCPCITASPHVLQVAASPFVQQLLRTQPELSPEQAQTASLLAHLAAAEAASPGTAGCGDGVPTGTPLGDAADSVAQADTAAPAVVKPTAEVAVQPSVQEAEAPTLPTPTSAEGKDAALSTQSCFRLGRAHSVPSPSSAGRQAMAVAKASSRAACGQQHEYMAQHLATAQRLVRLATPIGAGAAAPSSASGGLAKADSTPRLFLFPKLSSISSPARTPTPTRGQAVPAQGEGPVSEGSGDEQAEAVSGPAEASSQAGAAPFQLLLQHLLAPKAVVARQAGASAGTPLARSMQPSTAPVTEPVPAEDSPSSEQSVAGPPSRAAPAADVLGEEIVSGATSPGGVQANEARQTPFQALMQHLLAGGQGSHQAAACTPPAAKVATPAGLVRGGMSAAANEQAICSVDADTEAQAPSPLLAAVDSFMAEAVRSSFSGEDGGPQPPVMLACSGGCSAEGRGASKLCCAIVPLKQARASQSIAMLLYCCQLVRLMLSQHRPLAWSSEPSEIGLAD